MSTLVMSNIVNKEILRKIQSKTLKELHDALSQSFGPMGSNTCIKLEKAFNQYSKDGHTILKSINYNGFIEQAVKDDIESITRYITTTVGDGTTSAVILSRILFDGLSEYEEEANMSPYALIKTFQKVVGAIKDEILAHKRETTVDDIYDIAMISTNGNEEIAENIKNIYAEHGMDVFIDVAISNSVDSMLKIYDGMTLNAGYADSCFVNTKNSTSEVRNPAVYVFEDPVDTAEMITFFDAIISKNIITPFNNQTPEAIKPTVIMTPRLSRDLSSIMDSLAEYLLKIPMGSKPPISIVTNINQTDILMDIAKLCGAITIKKYINPDIQLQDIQKGLAPTVDNITDGAFEGHCDMIVVDAGKTKVINPKNMFNADGSKGDIYNAMVDYLETSIAKAKSEGEDNATVGKLKRRLNSLKANLVEYLVGGVTMADRDSVRDLVEDAVLNCRSASVHGVGYAANFEGLRASLKVVKSEELDECEKEIADIIWNAYEDLIYTLYDNSGISLKGDGGVFVVDSDDFAGPINIRTGKQDGHVTSSIESDIIILDTIAKIVSLMFTCNQFILPSPVHNIYVDN